MHYVLHTLKAANGQQYKNWITYEAASTLLQKIYWLQVTKTTVQCRLQRDSFHTATSNVAVCNNAQAPSAKQSIETPEECKAEWA